MADPTPVPVPVVPKTWTPENIIVFAGGAALFVLGALGETGVIVPPGVTTTVREWASFASQIVALGTSVAISISNNSVRKLAMKLNLIKAPIRLG